MSRARGTRVLSTGWRPSELQLAALRNIAGSSISACKPDAMGRLLSGSIARRTVNTLFAKGLVRWGGPVYFGCVLVSKRGEIALEAAAKRGSGKKGFTDDPSSG